MIRRSVGWWSALLIGGCVLACAEDDGQPTDPSRTPFGHQAPPVWTLQLDLSDLPAPDSAAAGDGTCYGRTGRLSFLADKFVQHRVSLAATTFAACLRGPSEFSGDVTWTWKASGGRGDSTWSATLRAFVVSPDSVIWWGRVVGTSEHFQDFFCMYGYCDGEATQGFWQFYHPEFPDRQVRLIESRWIRQPGVSELRTARFDVFGTTSDSAPEGVGEWAIYALGDSVATLRYHDKSDLEDDRELRVERDLRTGAGRWTQQGYPGDTEACCWGPRPERADQDCP